MTKAGDEIERAAVRGLTSVVVAGVELAAGLVPGPGGVRLPELPPPGDLQWPEVANALRRSGVRL